MFTINTSKTAKKIHSKIAELGVTVPALAEILGVSSQAIYKWFRGDCLPSMESLVNLAAMCGCTVDDFIATERSE